jgi:hypothetical protein
VRRLDAPGVLAWFQSRWGEPCEDELGGHVYGLGGLAQKVRDLKLAPPTTVAQLRRILVKHTYARDVRADRHTLRVATDDDEVALAYYFFDDEAAADTGRVAWLLHQEPNLPDGGSDRGFEPPFPVKAEVPRGDGDGVTYAVLLTFADSDSIPGKVTSFAGVRIPDLPAFLARSIPAATPQPWSAEYLATWPLELRLLRAMTDADDPSLEPALRRSVGFPTMALQSETNHTRLGLGPSPECRAELEAAARDHTSRGSPSRSIVVAHRHAALLCEHADAHFGYQQWVLFDDIWASAHPALAQSLLNYGVMWDPFLA